MDDYTAFKLLELVRDLHGVVFDVLRILLILFIFCFASVMISEFRKATSAVRHKPKTLLAYSTDLDVDTALKAVLEYALRSKYSLEHVDYRMRRIILRDKMSLLTLDGFFYPVYVSADGSGETTVEVGAVPRLPWISITVPGLSMSRERCFSEVTAAIWLRENRAD